SLQLLSRDCDILLVNGGLGPTVDDLTAEALAKVCGVPLAEHPEALAHLQQWCERRNYILNNANRKQALLPAGCEIVRNPTGSAVGFTMPLNGCQVICTPGVPSELTAMLDQEILPALTARFPHGNGTLRRFALFGAGESTLQQQITEAFPHWPAGVELGFRAALPMLELKLGAPGPDGAAAVARAFERIQPLIADVLIGEDDTSMAERVVELLRTAGLRLTCAESCTGGGIAALLTRIPGASDVFDLGVVSYSNGAKQQLLAVGAETLAQHGAVSEPVVLEMAAGALRLSGADLAVAVSGIAGPGGGTPDKPVGTVWIAWGSADDLQARQFYVPMERALFQEYVSTIALDLIRRRLQGIAGEPRYLTRKRPERA
ncbi:MAG: CinA family nicotinamide mononucleotide deamidase-related protein, partial [Spongiibacteraceae bacterium]|nr:CinA family nicotinamide mononucleotide deamidase-related protein [Spongiibacteraceae bacterium]